MRRRRRRQPQNSKVLQNGHSTHPPEGAAATPAVLLTAWPLYSRAPTISGAVNSGVPHCALSAPAAGAVTAAKPKSAICCAKKVWIGRVGDPFCGPHTWAWLSGSWLRRPNAGAPAHGGARAAAAGEHVPHGGRLP
jgi:hypothetical protein